VNGTGEGAPLTTLLVLDISGSMNHANKLENARSVAKSYIGQSRLDDKVGILAFNESIDLVQGVTSDQNALYSALDGLKAKDDTAMYDALVKAIDVLNPLDGRKAIIVLTDGMDNHSRHTAQDVLAAIGQSGLSISTIGLGNPGQSTGNLAALDEAGLRALAEQAGGQYGYASDLASLQALYELYGRSLKSEYAITYTSPATLHDGFNRSLSVSLVGSNLAPLSPATESKYNPGGVLPETTGPSWPLFVGLLAALLVILSLPLWLPKIKTGKQAEPAKPADKAPTAMKGKPPAKPRIKLK
jgi:VWFA-related protein